MPGVPQEDNTGQQRICFPVLQADAEEERQAKGLGRHRATAGRHEGLWQARSVSNTVHQQSPTRCRLY